MASIATIKHRFANKDFGANGQLLGSHNSIIGRNYYSYSTVFGQWLDIEKNVCIIYTGCTSNTSHKHQLWLSDFPKNVNVFPYDDGGTRCGYSEWHGCRLIQPICNTSDDMFTFDHRVKLMDYWTNEVYSALADINGGTSKGLIERAEHTIGRYLSYYNRLFQLYSDVSFKKYVKVKRTDDKKEWKRKNTMIKLLADDADVKTIVDTIFGDGVYDAYYNRCGGFRKADETRKKMFMLCERLGICNPYNSWDNDRFDSGLTAKQIRKLSAKERNELHFRSIMYKESKKLVEEHNEHKKKVLLNAFKYITGHECCTVNFPPSSRTVHKCRNMFTGEEYVTHYNSFGLCGLELCVVFDYEDFASSLDKEEWIKNFYRHCKLVDSNVRAVRILDRFGDAVYTMQHIGYFRYKMYTLNDVVRNGTTDEEYAVCESFINRWNAQLHDKEVRERLARLQRAREEAEKLRERQFKEQVKQEQISACAARGAEGCRDMWRTHLTELAYAKNCCETEDFFYGGNVLLRFNLDKTRIETSKEVKIDVKTCKKFYKIIKQWHEKPKTFKPIDINTRLSGTYTISSYENDILTAGCHEIAYREMERMYNEIIENENGKA